MTRRSPLLALAVLTFALGMPSSASAAGDECDLEPRAQCFGVESLEASLSTTRAGAHPDVSFSFTIKQDPESKPNAFGMKDAYAPTRNVRIELPSGLIGDPNVLGVPNQCTVEELVTYTEPGGGCPNGSQIGISNIFAYELEDTFLEPVYMMQAPGGDTVARLGFIAGLFPTFIDLRVRSERQDDYGLTAEITEASTEAKLLRADTTTWGVPAAESHDRERCTSKEAFLGCKLSVERPPGSRPLPFMTNPTRCGVPLEMRVAASSWVEPQRFDTKSASFPQITECNRLPYGPSLAVDPTSHRAGAPTGLEVTFRQPASDGIEVLEPSQTRDIRIDFPPGLAVNTGSADGLEACSEDQVRLGKRENAACPDAAKLADAEFDIPALPRRMKGAIYLRDPEPGNNFRFWIVADDLGLHIKLPGQLLIDSSSGQIESIVLDVPQAPLRESKIVIKSGFRAAFVNPPACGTYLTSYEFTPWSGGLPIKSSTPMKIDEGCEGLGTFSPKLSAGTTDPRAGQHSPFLFTLTRQDGEQNPAALDITLPRGLAATFAGIPRCGGLAAQAGACPAASRIGRVVAAIGYGSAPLWVPQPAKRPTAVYLGGSYKGAPLSIVSVVPAQAGPFDFGDEVVRSALFVDPVTGQGSVRSDPLPQIKEGIPLRYRTIQVQVDRPNFILNPTGCARKEIEATVTSTLGAIAKPSTPFEATNCAILGFKPRLSFRLRGGTQRGSHPALRAVVRPRPGDSNIAAASVALPHSEFLDQSHIGTVCTRVQFAVDKCPAASIYGHVVAHSPLFEETLSGPVYLRSSSHPLPDLVAALSGPPSLPLEVDLAGRVDSVNGGIRTTFDLVPDAPVSSFILSMQSGKKGLLVNSTNLCARAHRATAQFTAQNGRKQMLRPTLKVSCKQKR